MKRGGDLEGMAVGQRLSNPSGCLGRGGVQRSSPEPARAKQVLPRSLGRHPWALWKAGGSAPKGQMLLQQLRDGKDLGKSAWIWSGRSRPSMNVVWVEISKGIQSPSSGLSSLDGQRQGDTLPTTLVKIQRQSIGRRCYP